MTLFRAVAELVGIEPTTRFFSLRSYYRHFPYCRHTLGKRGAGAGKRDPSGVHPKRAPSHFTRNQLEFGARGRTRTGTTLTDQGILSPWRLPIPPLGLEGGQHF